MLLAFHKPFGVLSQFTLESPGQRTLAEFGFPSGVYPVGRLDLDSEGLLLLTDEKSLVDRLLNPRHGHPRTYAVQVEGVPTANALAKLAGGVEIQGRRTLPCQAGTISNPQFPPREPPIRHRLSVPTAWLEITLCEGRNRQVRRMTAAVGLPTLRLIRVGIGRLRLGDLTSGTWKELSATDRRMVLEIR